jgi:hydrogenase-4 component B
MLVPQAWLAVACLALGLFPGQVLRAVGGVTVSLPGLSSAAGLAHGPLGLATGPDISATVIPSALGLTVLAAAAIAAIVAGVFRLRRIVRRAPTWGCGGVLSPVTEYTGTAFSKPLLMIFRAVYRPTREVEALADVSPYFPQEVRYRVEIEATFERYIYRPLTQAVISLAERMKVLQAGSLHAYLAYVLVLGLILLTWLGGR